jgi:hypothetical protein
MQSFRGSAGRQAMDRYGRAFSLQEAEETGPVHVVVIGNPRAFLAAVVARRVD